MAAQMAPGSSKRTRKEKQISKKKYQYRSQDQKGGGAIETNSDSYQLRPFSK